MKTILLAAALVLGCITDARADKKPDCVCYPCTCNTGGADKKPGCKCDPCECNKNTASARADAVTLGFNSMAFYHEADGTVKFSRVTTQHKSIGGNAPPRDVVYTAEQFSESIITVNGKKVTDAELEAWTSKTVNAQVKIGPNRADFFGGEPAYQIITLASTGARVLGTSPQSFPLIPTGGCSDGRCGIPQQQVAPYYIPQQQGGCPNGRCPTGR